MASGTGYLHVLNGDSTAFKFQESGLEGEVLVWREALAEGPLMGWLPEDEFWRVRGEYVSHAFQAPIAAGQAYFELELRKLAQAEHYHQVVLWFEFDLFCQINLICALSQLHRAGIAPGCISLICPAEHPEVPNFMGLGQLSGKQLAELFPARVPVSRRLLQAADQAWRAYCGADPSALESISLSENAEFPALAPALRAHLARFPSAFNGLGFIEHWMLAKMAKESVAETTLFQRFWHENPVYGFGDTQLKSLLNSLEFSQVALAERRAGLLQPTEVGLRVLTGEWNMLELNSPDHWLGGVHLQPGNYWRWDSAAGKLVPPVRQG